MSKMQIGRYALVKMLARGGMADVWVGKAFGAGGFKKVVAIKILASDKLDHETYQRALNDEARITVALQHPNIVDLYDFNFEGDKPYLVMEYVEGTELRDLLRSLRARHVEMPLPIAAHIVSEISKGLEHAHSRVDPETAAPLRIVHRDVSPSNILISTQGQVKLGDFGIAKSTLQSGATQVGEIKGKFRYMSPEQAKGESLDFRSDIYSLGLVLYECLFGNPAYNDTTDVRLIELARLGEILLPADLDPDLRAILKKLLAPDPDDRYDDLKAFRRDLGEHLAKIGDGIDEESFKNFLGGLEIPQFKEAALVSREVDQWDPVPSSQVLDETGTIKTVAEVLPDKRKKRRAIIVTGVVVSIAALSFVLIEVSGLRSTPPENPSLAPQKGSLAVDSNPTGALIRINYGKKTVSEPAPIRLTDLPLGVEMEVSAAEKGYESVSRKLKLTTDQPSEELTLTLTESRPPQVSFSAIPFALVSIPGRGSKETPFTAPIPPGSYQITFFHEPSGKKATASLVTTSGQAYRCYADMAIGEPSKMPEAHCVRR